MIQSLLIIDSIETDYKIKRSLNNLNISKKIKKIKVNKSELANMTRYKLQKRNKQNNLKRRPNLHKQIIECLKNFNNENTKCPICLDTLIHPILTSCGHSFCLHCAQNAFKSTNKCCLCRNDLNQQELLCSKTTKNIIDLSINHQGKDEIKDYKLKLQQFDVRQKKRRVSNQNQIGDLIDMKIQNKWQIGQITQKFNDSIIAKRYFKKDSIERYIFKLNSKKIATLHTFTKKMMKVYQKQQVQTPVRYNVTDNGNTNSTDVNLLIQNTYPIDMNQSELTNTDISGLQYWFSQQIFYQSNQTNRNIWDLSFITQYQQLL